MKTLNLISIVFLFFNILCFANDNRQKKPNILVILSDDQGIAELGTFSDFAEPSTLAAKNIEALRKITASSSTEAPVEVCNKAASICMPNLDAIARKGLRFTSFYAAATCAPTRAALLSASYPQRHGIYGNPDVESKSSKGLNPSVKLPVKLLQEAGYQTGLSGKWHIGMQGEGYSPLKRGFDWYFAFDKAGTDKYNSKDLYCNDEKVPAKGWLADQITDEAIGFMERAQDEEKPFFLYVAYNEPHGPMPRPPKKYLDAINSGSDIVDVHFASIYGMDAGIGRMLDYLKKTGELDNTLIIYASDNGVARGCYHYGFSLYGPSYWGEGAKEPAYLVPVPGNGPFKGCKWTPWEGGIRVPMVAILPGGKKGSSNSLLSVMDIIPTALDYAGVEIPDSYDLDGQSFLPVLKTGQDINKGRTLFWAMDAMLPLGDFGAQFDYLDPNGNEDFEKGLHKGPVVPSWYVRTPKWKLMAWDTIAPVLIDIENDLAETTDVAAKHPEVVRKLSSKFATWMKDKRHPISLPVEYYEVFKNVK